MKIQSPKIKYLEDKLIKDAIKDNEFNCINFKNDSNEKLVIKDVTIDSCVFDSVDLKNVIFENVDFVDVIFKNVDLSFKNFNKRYFARVQFINCKLMACNFSNSTLKDIEIKECNCNYINLGDCKLTSVSFYNSTFVEASFLGCQIKNMDLNRIDFNKAEFYETNLVDVDFSTCKIEGCKFDYKSIKGIIIDMDQSHYLIGMLGVKIK